MYPLEIKRLERGDFQAAAICIDSFSFTLQERWAKWGETLGGSEKVEGSNFRAGGPTESAQGASAG